jgi:hypothetical protein
MEISLFVLAAILGMFSSRRHGHPAGWTLV